MQAYVKIQASGNWDSPSQWYMAMALTSYAFFAFMALGAAAAAFAAFFILLGDWREISGDAIVTQD